MNEADTRRKHVLPRLTPPATAPAGTKPPLRSSDSDAIADGGMSPDQWLATDAGFPYGEKVGPRESAKGGTKILVRSELDAR